jgi:acetyl-CoA synthetase
MSHDRTYPVSATARACSFISERIYLAEYQRSIRQPDTFWREKAAILAWARMPTRIRDVQYDPHEVRIRWFEDGLLNASFNCVDRHLKARGDRAAIIWESDDPAHSRTITYRELYDHVGRLANALKALGVHRGDRVAIYLPMVPEAVYAMLACARIGAVHSVVFGGFSPASLRDRIRDCDAGVLITADEGVRAGRRIPLKANADRALAECRKVHTCIVVQRTGAPVKWVDGRDVWYHVAVAGQKNDCPPEIMGAEDPLFVLYTSGSTGKPKGVVHTTAGYLLHCAYTHRFVFNYLDGEVYWCTADVGWVTGHSYIVYGPLANGATTLLFEGVPTYPSASRLWDVVDKHQVNILYTAPTAIRALMRHGDHAVTCTSRRSLRLLGSVGEPINPEAWEWYHRVVGEGRCPIVDTWWQTETGGILISPLPGATPLKPGSATRPFFGVQPVLVDDQGRVLEGEAEGNLCLADGGPGMARTQHGDHDRFVQTYFARFPGLYFTGDGARRDGDGYYWITGRIDDVINVSGHRLGTAEVESALATHPRVAEAAVVGCPDLVKGQGIYAFVTLKSGEEPSETLRQDLIGWVRMEIGPLATPDVVQWAPNLPKTRSGKIMRRILRHIAAGNFDDIGDTTTLAEPAVVKEIVAGAASRKSPTEAAE